MRPCSVGARLRVVLWNSRTPRCCSSCEIRAEATAGDTDVVVVGSRGHSALAGMLLGSVSQGLLRHAHGAVVVAR